MQNTISKNEGKALMKLVVNTDDDQLLGAHMVGPEAAEILMVRPSPNPLSSAPCR